ncbi:MAG: DHA2 family efflux MFS transporter permease subunit [Hyphomonadaceae bacterium]|nr:DHA2 family efflux MFS transporter permease subunit [Hyphomonadaceae bacterium]
MAARKGSLLIPITVGSAFFMEGLDATILTTALPQIAKDFGVAAPEVGGAITSYLLSLAIFIPVSGWVADRFGAKRTYCAALVVFTLGSALCAMATGPLWLALARGVQGLGGALLTPVGRLILARSFPKDELIHAMSFMIIPGLIGPVVGPVLGGFIATYTSWHWIFLINLPLGALGLALALVYLPDIDGGGASTAFDFRGFGLIVLALAPLQFALESLAAAHVSWTTTGALLVISAAGLLAYIAHARTHARPLIDLNLLRIRTFAVAVGAGFLSRVAIASAPFLLPILFQSAFGMTALHSGLLVFSMAVGQLVMRMWTTPMLRALGVRNSLALNGVCIGLSTVGFALLTEPRADWIVFVYGFVCGLSQCVQLSVLAALHFSGVEPDAASRATAFSSVTQRFAAAFGVAISASLLQAFGGSHLRAADFNAVFLIVGAIALAAVPFYLMLRQGDGADLMAKGAKS